jgi:hypothetical protein
LPTEVPAAAATDSMNLYFLPSSHTLSMTILVLSRTSRGLKSGFSRPGQGLWQHRS